MTTMSSADRAAFTLTEDRVAELKKREGAARIVFVKAETEFAKAELAYAKNFTPIIFHLLASAGQVTSTEVFRQLVGCGLAPNSLRSYALAENIITAHVQDGLIFKFDPERENTDAVFKATGRYACLAPA